jgi:hypothetical protein
MDMIPLKPERRAQLDEYATKATRRLPVMYTRIQGWHFHGARDTPSREPP